MALGFWQLERREWKAELIAAIEAAPGLPEVDLAALPPAGALDFRRARARCRGSGLSWQWSGGESALRPGRPAYVARVVCPPALGQPAFAADLGALPRPDNARPPVDLDVALEGILRDFGDRPPPGQPRFRLIASQPPPGLGLEPAAPPDASAVSDNHLGYAIQWFSFAAMLAIVWAIHVRRWRRSAAGPGDRAE